MEDGADGQNIRNPRTNYRDRTIASVKNLIEDPPAFA